MKKPNFTDKARSIIRNTSKIENLDDFLSENVKDQAFYPKESNNLLNMENVQGKTSLQTDHSAKNQVRISREEFRFSSQLAERLRFAAFSLRKNKTQIIKEALETYLKKNGF